ncbi:MAG TPA: rRNA maturation RNase YbeY [Rubrobacter sp.]|nr:rRNA maturation RNase YbeY [Rubrobacter sp.]
MPFAVAVLDEVGYAGLDEGRAAHLFAAAFSRMGIDLGRVGEVSVALVDPDTIWDLNSRFRDKDEPTDVLSFEVDGPYGEMVGEVVVCPGCARPEMGVEELVVHGALHLVGMDHGEDFEGGEMALVQEAVMEEVRGDEEG